MPIVRAKQTFEEGNKPLHVREPVRVWASRNAYALIAAATLFAVSVIINAIVEVVL